MNSDYTVAACSEVYNERIIALPESLPVEIRLLERSKRAAPKSLRDGSENSLCVLRVSSYFSVFYVVFDPYVY